MTRAPKPATSYRVSSETLRLTSELADRLATTKTAVIERAIRVLARQEGLK